MQKFERPLYLELKASRTLLAAFSALHLLVLIAWWQAPVAPSVVIAAGGMLALHWLYCYRFLIAGSSPAAVSRLAWDSVRGWRIYRQADGWRPVQLLTPVFVSSHLTVAGFRLGRFNRCSAIVVADRVGREEFRRLRVRLLQSAHGR